MKRIALRSVIAVASVVVLLGVAALWAFGTVSGARTVFRLADSLLPESLSVGSIEGRLAGSVVLNDVSFETDDYVLDIGRLQGDWQPAALLSGTAEFDRIEMSGVDFTALRASESGEPEQTREPFAVPETLDLPVDVAIHEFLMQDVVYREGSDQAPFVIDRVRLAARWTESEITLVLDEIEGPEFSVTGQAQVVPRTPYETVGRLQWSARPPDYAEISGSTEVSGTLRSLVVTQRIDAPYRIDAELRIEDLLDQRGVDGVMRFDLASADIGGSLPDLSLAGEISIDGTPTDLELRLDMDLTTPAFGSARLEASAAYGADRVTIHSGELTHAESGATLTAAGSVMLSGAPRVDLSAGWSGLRWPLSGDPDFVSESGNVTLEGGIDDYRISLAGDLTAHALPGRFRLSGTGTTEALDLERIEIDGLGGRISGNLSARFGADVEGALSLDIESIDPAALVAGLTGEIDGTIRASGRLGESITVELTELALAGRFRDRDVEVSANGFYDAGTLEIDRLDLRSGGSVVNASGRVGSDVDAVIALESPDLGDLWPGLEGELSVDAAVQGPRNRPDIDLDAAGSGLILDRFRAGDLVASAAIGRGGIDESSLDIRLTNGRLAGTPVESFRLVGEGDADRHAIDIEIAGPPGLARVALDGRVESAWQPGMRWHFSLTTASVEPAAHPGWRLASASSGTIGADAATLERTCLQQDDRSGRLCLEASRSTERLSAQFELTSLPLDVLTAFATAPVTIEGTLDAAGDVAVDAGRSPVVDVRLSSTSGRVTQSQGTATLSFGELEGTLAGADDAYAGELAWPLADSGRIALDARLGPVQGDGARSVDGSAAVSIPDLGFVSGFHEAISDVSGALRADVTIGGTLGSPRVEGEVSLTEGAITLPALDATYRNVSARLNGDPAGAFDVEARAESGGGTLQASGRLSIADGVTGELVASGEAFELMDTADAMITVSPDLEVSIEPDRVDVSGSVRVPAARITPGDSGPEAVTVSRDEVIVGDDEDGEAEAGIARPLHAEIALELGEDVEIEAFGLSGTLAGSIEITEAPGEPATGSGELRVAGTYEAYGQQLEVRTGQLLFAGGPLTRPGLNIEAVRRPADDILVGARVTGTLEQPDLALFSEPSMQQQDQLSYLVLGRPASGVSASEQSALSRAVMALGLRGGRFVSDRINETLGFDEFGIQTEPGAQASSASFVVGKYLSPSLYVSYGIGLFESVSSLNLRYTISDRWQVLTESSSEGSGGDLIYSIERSSDSRESNEN